MTYGVNGEWYPSGPCLAKHVAVQKLSTTQTSSRSGIAMKLTYVAPSVTEFGSIADCTFATPNNGGSQIKGGGDNSEANGGTAYLGGGNYACGPTAGDGDQKGGKSWMVLQCDKHGEYSHS